MLRNADAAMYRAKSEGRNGFRFYSPEMTEKARARITLEADLRRALDASQFFMLLQPRLSLRTGRLVGAEALIRWNHPSEGILLPERFISVAESTGHIERIGAWMLEAACMQLRRWADAGIGELHLAVNLSKYQILHGDLVDTVRQAAQRAGCDPTRLELEINEGCLIERPDVARATLEQLRDIKARIAIDDFGSGHSSLTHLKTLPVSTIKIDRAFVRDIALSQSDRAIATAIIALGKGLGLTVVAEGVETPEQAAFLQASDCDEAQGYLYSKPLTEDAFFRFWEACQGRAGESGDDAQPTAR